VRVLAPLATREIEHFGSHGFIHTRIAHGDVHVSKADLDGLIGGHEAASRQLLVVLSGRVEVATRAERAELGVGEAVEWQEGEWRETRSLEPTTLLLVEGAFE
jgi:mannose-6-phosphate isomerase-like protein (cupin superfamily)